MRFRMLMLAGAVLALGAAGLRADLTVTTADVNGVTAIEALLESLAPGETLYLHGGTYTSIDEHITVNGSSGSPITLAAVDGEIPILVGDYGTNYN